jgi:hypothetical protein
VRYPEPRRAGPRHRRVRRLVAIAVAVIVVASGCGRSAEPAGPPGTGTAATGTATPPPPSYQSPPATAGAATIGPWSLRYRLLVHYPDFAYCDPDLYPVARVDHQPAADQWWIAADHASAEVSAILAHHGFHEPLTSDQRLTAYRDHKSLTVISMSPVPIGYRYQLSITATSGGEPDHTVTGEISLDGTIREISRQARRGGCPICLEAETTIATPAGEISVALIRPGDTVWTTTAAGRRIAAPVLQVVRRATPGPHLMLRLALSDGRAVIAAGAHPAADGTLLRELAPGRQYDGATIASTTWMVSTAAATFDLLPAGPTGTYWANGLLIGTTLRP